MKYLADTSAMTRIQRRQVDPVWLDLAGRGLLSVCEPVSATKSWRPSTRDPSSGDKGRRDSAGLCFPPGRAPSVVFVQEGLRSGMLDG